MKFFKSINPPLSGTVVFAQRTMKRSMVLALVLTLGWSLLPAAAFAKTPDGQTPAEESECDVLSGAAFGICNAYCEATDCGDGVNYANFQACASLQKNWVKKTGLRELPCECADGDVFVPGTGCACGVDLTVVILSVTPAGNCDPAIGCDTDVLLSVANLGVEDVPEDIRIAVELGNGAMEFVNQPGLAARDSEEILTTLTSDLPCADANGICIAKATVDPDNEIDECDELNNVDTWPDDAP